MQLIVAPNVIETLPDGLDDLLIQNELLEGPVDLELRSKLLDCLRNDREEADDVVLRADPLDKGLLDVGTGLTDLLDLVGGDVLAL